MRWSILASVLSFSLAVSASPLTEIPTKASEKRDITYSNLPASEPKCTNVNTKTKLTVSLIDKERRRLTHLPFQGVIHER